MQRDLPGHVLARVKPDPLCHERVLVNVGESIEMERSTCERA
jgi:hypothetical protein